MNRAGPNDRNWEMNDSHQIKISSYIENGISEIATVTLYVIT